VVLDPSFPEPEMPHTARAPAANYCYHVLNRGNHRAQVFHKDDDYQAFVNLLPEASLRVLAYCLMPNHFHLVVWLSADGDLRGRLRGVRAGFRFSRRRGAGAECPRDAGLGRRAGTPVLSLRSTKDSRRGQPVRAVSR